MFGDVSDRTKPNASRDPILGANAMGGPETPWLLG
jgi:hypothetical protein